MSFVWNVSPAGTLHLRKAFSFSLELKGAPRPCADRAMSLWSSCLCCWSSVAMACWACCCMVCTKCCMCWKASICKGMMEAVRITGLKYNFSREKDNVEMNFHWNKNIWFCFLSKLFSHWHPSKVTSHFKHVQINEEVRDSCCLWNCLTEEKITASFWCQAHLHCHTDREPKVWLTITQVNTVLWCARTQLCQSNKVTCTGRKLQQQRMSCYCPHSARFQYRYRDVSFAAEHELNLAIVIVKYL